MHEAERSLDPDPEETLVADTHAGLTQAQFVERKLAGLLKMNRLRINHIQRRSLLSRRSVKG